MAITVFLVLSTWVMSMLMVYHQTKIMSNSRLSLLLGIAAGIAITFFFSTVILLTIIVY
jgi:hypothetical protein